MKIKHMPRYIDLPDTVTGWFAVAYSKSLQPGQWQKVVLAEQVYRLVRLQGGSLQLDGSDQHVLEQNDIIYIWYEKQNQLPNWYIPRLDNRGWSKFKYHEFKINTHLQEVYENSVDVAHFKSVHDFKHLSVLEGPCFEQHTMMVKHAIQRKNAFLLTNKKYITAYFEVRLYGLGCAHTHIDVPDMNLSVRMMTLATPITANLLTIRIAVAIRQNHSWCLTILQNLMQHLIFKKIIGDFYQDLPIWKTKNYLKRPLLVSGDGPIIKFRRWCQQFY